MANLLDLFVQGGPMMKALAGMSFGMFVCVVQRGQFWSKVLRKQKRVAHDVLEAARYDLGKAAAIAELAQTLPMGRFLLAPLSLKHPTPETFHLALEAAADKEFVEMRKGNRQLELVVTIAPLMGLLGAAIAIIGMFGNTQPGSAGGLTTQNFLQGIRQAMIPVATSLIVEIIALSLSRLAANLQSRQVEYFSEVGNKLELFYREFWQAAQRTERLKAVPDNRYSSSPTLKAIDSAE